MKHKGFSLLEMVVVILMFSILMQAVLGVFSSVYSGFARFRTKVNYNDNARTVSDFIRDEIRLAGRVSIQVTDSGVKVIEPKVTSSCLGIEGGLDEIKLHTTGGTIGSIKMKSNVSGGTINPKKGKYSLVYEANGTENIISDLVNEIKVVRTTNSDYVTFECVISKVGDTTTTSQLQQSFTESLAYKEKVN